MLQTKKINKNCPCIFQNEVKNVGIRMCKINMYINSDLKHNDV